MFPALLEPSNVSLVAVQSNRNEVGLRVRTESLETSVSEPLLPCPQEVGLDAAEGPLMPDHLRYGSHGQLKVETAP